MVESSAVLGERFRLAVERFDAINKQDPHLEDYAGAQVPHEWIDSQRLHAWVLKLDPNASEALQLASRCQHLKRWERPRSHYAEGRAGYLKWRQELKQFHAAEAAQILKDVGYDEKTLARIKQLNLKEGLASDSEVQVLEDALCLVFLEFEFAEFCERKEDEMLVRILKKSWGKMSASGHEAALKLNYNEHQQRLLKQALETKEGAG